MKYLLLFFGLFILSNPVLSEPTNFQTFMPDNNLHLEEIEGRYDNRMTEREFNSIIDKVSQHYYPIIQSFGKRLVMVKKWSDSTVNAQAYQNGDYWYVEMFGGLARRPEISKDGFALVVCHELGHHLGGFPTYRQGRWAAIEGQSDYFATIACAKQIWTNPEENRKYEVSVGKYGKDLCDRHLLDYEDRALCYRSLTASKTLARFLNDGRPVYFSRPDKYQVPRTSEYHPAAQCRLDTMVAGTLCPIRWNHNIIPRTEEQSSDSVCLRSEGYVRASRPRCWYRPTL